VVDGLGARGTIVETVHTKDGRHLLQIDSNQIDSGFSGAPVWDNELLKAVGMVRSALPSSPGGRLEDINFAVPGDVLQNILPKLSEATMAVLSNPFYAGGAVPSEMFVGRQDTLNLIRTRLGGRSPQSVSIVAERRMGKSSLLRYVCENSTKLFPGGKTILICLDLMKAYTQTRRGLMSALRKELKPKLGYEPWEAGQDGDLTELSFALEKLGRDGVRLILCLDEVEHLTERKEEFDSLLEELRAAAGQGQVGLLTASARPLADLASSSGLTSPFYNIFIQETLGLLKDNEWRELVQRYLPNVSEEELAAIQRLCGGHPFYTQLAAGRLWEACYAGGEADWQARAREDLLPHWTGWWKHLKPEEQNALCFGAGFSDRKPSDSKLKELTRRGLLRDGKPFSEAFTEWMECKS
jgi:hypothetical protein